MKRRLTQADADKAREEYERWDKFGADSETADELAKRLGMSKASLYRLKERYWKVGVPAATRVNVPTALWEGGDDVPAAAWEGGLAEVVRELVAELIAARVRIAELERERSVG